MRGVVSARFDLARILLTILLLAHLVVAPVRGQVSNPPVPIGPRRRDCLVAPFNSWSPIDSRFVVCDEFGTPFTIVDNQIPRWNQRYIFGATIALDPYQVPWIGSWQRVGSYNVQTAPYNLRPGASLATSNIGSSIGGGNVQNSPANADRRRSRQPIGRVPRNKEEYCCQSVFFVTDRKPTGLTEASNFFGGTLDAGDRLTYGTCEVSIPIDRRIGTLQSPSVWRLEFKPDLRKHVVLLNVTTSSHDEFFAAASEQIAESSGKQALVFIHGFNVTFESAARRTAQIAYDLKFDGAVILYSWPSAGRVDRYSYDEETVQITVPHLIQFLSELRTLTGATTIHLIAHSMGNRALAAAIPQIAGSGDSSPFRQIILTAPDINAVVFKQMASALTKKAGRITLYMSPRDKALYASRKRHLHPRAGDTILIIPGIDTIDASSVDTSFLGHSYFGDCRSVIEDIFDLIRDDRPPYQRFGLIARYETAGAGLYYSFRP